MVRGSLYLVSTPIGNLADLSARARAVLAGVSLILAEDTRHSRTLLLHFGITGRVDAYHEHNEAKATPKIIARLEAGGSVALISDAGTPLLSDPGARLVTAAIAAGITVVPVPGHRRCSRHWWGVGCRPTDSPSTAFWIGVVRIARRPSQKS